MPNLAAYKSNRMVLCHRHTHA